MYVCTYVRMYVYVHTYVCMLVHVLYAYCKKCMLCMQGDIPVGSHICTSQLVQKHDLLCKHIFLQCKSTSELGTPLYTGQSAGSQ